MKNFGTAIMSNKVTGDSGNKSNKEGTLTLIIEDSEFSNCYKGLYVTNLDDLTVTGSIFDEIGKASTPPESGEPTIPEKMKRSEQNRKSRTEFRISISGFFRFFF